MEILEEPSDGVRTDPDAGPPQLGGDLGGGLAGPFQLGHRIARGLAFQEFSEAREDLGRFFSTGLRPAPGRRTRAESVSLRSKA